MQLLQLAGPRQLLLAGRWLVVKGLPGLGTVIAFVTVLGLRFALSLQALANSVRRP